MKKIVLRIVISLISIYLAFVLYHNVARFFSENAEYELGLNEQYITIDGKKVRVYDSGIGENTIVLLSGYGTGSPIIDFKYLTKELEKQYRVIVIEGFGYGYSDDTDKERTIENICSEINFVINQIVPEKKVILMVHSISGIYSLYYADQYPEDVAGIIGIDNSVPKQMIDPDMPKLNAPFFTFVNRSGLIRLVLMFAPDVAISPYMSNTHSHDEIEDYKEQLLRNFMNSATTDEAARILENAEKTMNIRLPESIPMLTLIGTLDKGDFLDAWMDVHTTSLALHGNGTYKVFNGHHYLHHTHLTEIVIETNHFSSNIAKW